MGQTLTNGLYLPGEGERYCYDGLAANWTALDGLIGGYNAHIGNTTIHVTAADKEAWNGHVADSVKHVTAEDKAKWDAVTSKANDSDVVHKSGDETITGNKTFSSNVNVYNSDSATDTANIILKNSKAERGVESPEQSINFIDKNNNLLAKINCNIDNNNFTRLYITAYDINNNSEGIFLRKSPTGTTILPTTAGAVGLGNSSAHFYNVQTNRVNTLEPSSLSLPSGNVNDVIDISSYFSNTGSGDINSYTASANGWIYLRLGNISSCQIVLNDSSNRRLWGTSATGNVEQIIVPILKNTILTTTWVTNSTVNVATARFIPCQGNV